MESENSPGGGICRGVISADRRRACWIVGNGRVCCGCLLQESRYSKMEKADILEMTVAHLKFVHSARRSNVDGGRGGCHTVDASAALTSEASTGAAALRYLMGYNECVREVASYLAGDDGETGRLGDDVRAALMQHLDDCLRLRATAPIVASTRLPSPNVRGQFDDSRRPDIRASSPPSAELAVDAAGATPWRHRCDSGVYSGASSPAQADELAVGVGAMTAAALPSPIELTTTAREPIATSTTICCDATQLQQPLQTLDITMSTGIWRPW